MLNFDSTLFIFVLKISILINYSKQVSGCLFVGIYVFMGLIFEVV